MFREMRRKRQLLTQEASERILGERTAGVLAVAGDDGYPYAVPVSYVYAAGKIYVHSAVAGHKIDAVRREAKVSFCVIDQDTVVPETFTTHFRSVIAFGRVRLIEDAAEKWQALTLLGAKYASGHAAACEEEIRQQIARTVLLEITVEHLTGKEAIELVRKREAQG